MLTAQGFFVAIEGFAVALEAVTDGAFVEVGEGEGSVGGDGLVVAFDGGFEFFELFEGEAAFDEDIGGVAGAGFEGGIEAGESFGCVALVEERLAFGDPAEGLGVGFRVPGISVLFLVECSDAEFEGLGGWWLAGGWGCSGSISIAVPVGLIQRGALGGNWGGWQGGFLEVADALLEFFQGTDEAGCGGLDAWRRCGLGEAGWSGCGCAVAIGGWGVVGECFDDHLGYPLDGAGEDQGCEEDTEENCGGEASGDDEDGAGVFPGGGGGFAFLCLDALSNGIEAAVHCFLVLGGESFFEGVDSVGDRVHGGCERFACGFHDVVTGEWWGNGRCGLEGDEGNGGGFGFGGLIFWGGWGFVCLDQGIGAYGENVCIGGGGFLG